MKVGDIYIYNNEPSRKWRVLSIEPATEYNGYHKIGYEWVEGVHKGHSGYTIDRFENLELMYTLDKESKIRRILKKVDGKM